MLWVVQSNISYEPRYREVFQTLERGGIPYHAVDVQAHSTDIEYLEDIENPIAVIGSYTLTRYAVKRGWGPGVFLNDNFDFRAWVSQYHEALLNFDSQVVPVGEIQLTAPSFIRPLEDSKAFIGTVVAPKELESWKAKVYAYPDKAVKKETLVCVAGIKQTFAEYRLFILDGHVITGSRYKLGGIKSESNLLPQQIIEFGVKMAAIWSPARGFVLDVAETPVGPKIVEINNLNSAAFYSSNISKLVQAVEHM